jgi:hypothetical protein
MGMEAITFTIDAASLGYMMFQGLILLEILSAYAIFKYDLGEKFSLWKDREEEVSI